MVGTVRNVFFLIMCVIIAAILYFIFFGWTNPIDGGKYQAEGTYIGAIGTLSVEVEKSISKYYYDYVFIPTIRTNNTLAEDIGFITNVPMRVQGIYNNANPTTSTTTLTLTEDNVISTYNTSIKGTEAYGSGYAY